MTENEETIITLTFENAANENKKWEIAAVSGELLREYCGRAAKSLFTPVPQRVGIATKDGAIIQDWADKTVAQITEKYHTNHFVIGTPDQLGRPSFSNSNLKCQYYNVKGKKGCSCPHKISQVFPVAAFCRGKYGHEASKKYCEDYAPNVTPESFKAAVKRGREQEALTHFSDLAPSLRCNCILASILRKTEIEQSIKKFQEDHKIVNNR